jgi:HAD superfamily phosphatase (TIGR01668 family)
MNKKLIPFALAKSIYEVEPAFYAKLGTKAVLCDLDNTLDAYDILEPGEQAFALKKELDNLGIALYIASNNSSKRVRHYAQILGVRCASGLLKPFSFRLKKFLKREHLNPEDVLMVGDQIMTDVKSANGAHVRVLLVERLTPRDHWLSWLNRHLEKPIREKIESKRLAPNWRETL